MLSHFTDFTGYVVFIITSFLAGVESGDQCLLNSKVLSCFFGGHNEYKIMQVKPVHYILSCCHGNKIIEDFWQDLTSKKSEKSAICKDIELKFGPRSSNLT